MQSGQFTVTYITNIMENNKVEELLMELRSGGKESQDYKDLVRIIVNLENHLKDQQDIM